MNLPTEVFGDVVVVHTPDELGGDQCHNFEAFVGDLDRTNVVLDLDGTETIDSGGLTSLLNLQDKLREQTGNLKISASNAANRKILEMTRLDQRLEVFDNVIDAVKSYQ